MNKEEFYKWFNESFIKTTNGGVIVDDEWYDRVEKNHEDLRKKLGGIRKIQKIELDNIDPVCKWQDISEHASHLYTLIPDYFSMYQIDVGALVKPLVPKGKQHEGYKFGKHIAGYVLRHKKEIRGTEKDKTINDLLCKIGAAWSAAKSRKDTLYVNISTDPIAFTYVGGYGPDNGSCFRQLAQNHHHKFILGQTKNTFVIVISAKEQEEKYNDPNNLCRLWGMCNDDMTEIILSNRYISTTYAQHGNINKAVEVAFSNITGLKYNTFMSGKGIIRFNGVYQNADTYALTTEKKDIKEKTVVLDQTNFNSISKCCNDNNFGQLNKLIVKIDDRYYCPICVKNNNAKFCEYSKSWTFKTLTKCFDKSYNKIKVSERYINTDFIRCSKTGEYHHIDNIVGLDLGTPISRRFLENSDLRQCPYCSQYADKETFSVNNDILEGIEVCAKCSVIKKKTLSKNQWATV